MKLIALWKKISSKIKNKNLREIVRREQNFCCASCGESRYKLEVHHRVPRSRGGANNRENIVGLCTKCHKEWDETSLTTDIIYPGIHITKTPRSLFQ